jgi:hypothetical protein
LINPKENLVKKLIVLVLSALAWLSCGDRAQAQAAPKPDDPHLISNQDLDLMRQDIRSHKKQLIAQNLKLSDAEATKFWPVYDKYVAELVRINDKKFGLIQTYADQYATMTDDQAISFAKQWTELDTQISQLRQKYVPIFAQVLNGRNTATFIQMDRRITMMIELQISSKMPLVQNSQN